MKSTNLFAVILLSLLPIILPAQFSWVQKANFGAGTVTEARAFSIAGYGYVGGPTPYLWRYDPVSDSWTQMAAFIGPTRSSPVAFSIGIKGYIGTGGSFNDFYEYDAATNTWAQKANFGGSGREGALGIAIDGKGYIGTGGAYLNDWWEYNPSTNSWTQKANLAGPARYHGGAFVVGSKGYVCTGFNGSFFNDLWEYDPAANAWTAKASLPGPTRDRPVGLATASKGYIISGWTGSVALNDAWEYDPAINSWTQLPSMPSGGRYNSCGFTIVNKLYVGTGYMGGASSDWWAFGPDCISQVSTQDATCGGYCDGQATVAIPAPGAITTYQWSDGQTSPTAINLCAGTYTVAVTDTSGCTSISSFTISEPPPVSATAYITQPGCAGDSNGVLCALPNTSPASLLWSNGDTSACLQNIAAGIYTVTVTDSVGCTGTVPLTLTEPGAIIINFNTNNATCQTCANGSASAQITGGTPPLSYLWSTGGTLAFQNNLLPGNYSICVTDANGCSSCDTVTINYPSSLQEMSQAGFAITPNPFSDQLTIAALDPSNIFEVQMFDMAGRVLHVSYSTLEKSITLHTGTLPAGLYVLKLITTKGVFALSVVKGG